MTETTNPAARASGKASAVRGGVGALVATAAGRFAGYALELEGFPPDLVGVAELAVVGIVGGILGGVGQWSRRRGGSWADLLGWIGCVAMAVLVSGCVAFDGRGYLETSRPFVGADAPTRVTAPECAAHAAAAAALEDDQGDGWALKVPLGRGREIEELAELHRRQAILCTVAEERGDALTPADSAAIAAAWRRQWAAGERLVKGE